MKVIHKYPLLLATSQQVQLPEGSEILTVQVQNETPCLWVLVNPEAKTENRQIVMYVTVAGIEAMENHKYIGTCQYDEGAFVTHFFKIKN